MPRSRLALDGIPGAVVAVVQGDETLYLRGFGRADLAGSEPVPAQKMLFRAGSISKLLTWTAVMQLVERGLLDLQAHVNRYLHAFQVPATYPKPITLAHLLTPTARRPEIHEGSRICSVITHDEAGVSLCFLEKSFLRNRKMR
jgi:CubicO group peptidase (beta-lactamase class C family)